MKLKALPMDAEAANAIFVLFCAGVLVGLVVLLNVSEHVRRAKLTPDERKREDEEIHWELHKW